MRLALDQARGAIEHDDVPIGAVVVLNDEVIAAARNERELRRDPTAHAEILALRVAAAELGSWRLSGAELFVTLEPCAMCAGALVLARVERLIFGPQDHRGGAALSLYNIVQDPRLNHSMTVASGVLAQECLDLLQGFFQTKRA